MRWGLAGGAPLALCLAAPALAEAPGPVLELPVDCEMGRLCIVQNYVDQDPGPEARDFTCGPLSYDGHKGTDIRVPGLVAMRRGVPVLAAAAGRVKAVRDGMADVSIRDIDPADIEGREAGNGVVIAHADGWETQYSHLMQGSLRVAPGDEVRAGQALGLIGLSGQSEFPHLHFSLRHDGKTVDPFTGGAVGSGCGTGGSGHWSERAAERLAYRAGGPLLAGFTDARPDLKGVLQGAFREAPQSTSTPALVFWAVSWGLRGGDRERLTIRTPSGTELVGETWDLPRNKAQWFRFAGKRRPDQGWEAGRYRADYSVTRQEAGRSVEIVNISREIELR